mmetsp:Transcript_47450/g.124357  ORF Transcript_47450/g.124357 Transcript_47450/m.124357 type:complete len:455 (-) Transcript_47450:1148-2512(-)
MVRLVETERSDAAPLLERARALGDDLRHLIRLGAEGDLVGRLRALGLGRRRTARCERVARERRRQLDSGADAQHAVAVDGESEPEDAAGEHGGDDERQRVVRLAADVCKRERDGVAQRGVADAALREDLGRVSERKRRDQVEEELRPRRRRAVAGRAVSGLPAGKDEDEDVHEEGDDERGPLVAEERRREAGEADLLRRVEEEQNEDEAEGVRDDRAEGEGVRDHEDEDDLQSVEHEPVEPRDRPVRPAREPRHRHELAHVGRLLGDDLEGEHDLHEAEDGGEDPRGPRSEVGHERVACGREVHLENLRLRTDEAPVDGRRQALGEPPHLLLPLAVGIVVAGEDGAVVEHGVREAERRARPRLHEVRALVLALLERLETTPALPVDELVLHPRVVGLEPVVPQQEVEVGARRGALRGARRAHVAGRGARHRRQRERALVDVGVEAVRPIRERAA